MEARTFTTQSHTAELWVFESSEKDEVEVVETDS